MDKVKLTSEDWDALMPGAKYKLGNTSLQLRPLTITEITEITRIFKKTSTTLLDRGIDSEDYFAADNLAIIAEIIIEAAPGIVSDCSGLDVDDVKRLPVEWAIDLIRELIEINLGAKSSLEKNLTALTETIKGVQEVSGK